MAFDLAWVWLGFVSFRFWLTLAFILASLLAIFGFAFGLACLGFWLGLAFDLDFALNFELV